MDFFGIPDPGIFYFGLDRKILKIPKSRESGFENPEIPGLGIWKSQNPRARDLKIPKSPGSGFLFSGYPRDLGFFESRDFYPRDSGFLFSLGIFGIFDLRDIPGIFYPRDRDFYPGMGYVDKKPTLNHTILILNLI